MDRMVEYLDDPSWRIRKAAVSAVNGLEPNRALIAALIEGLHPTVMHAYAIPLRRSSLRLGRLLLIC